MKRLIKPSEWYIRDREENIETFRYFWFFVCLRIIRRSIGATAERDKAPAVAPLRRERKFFLKEIKGEIGLGGFWGSIGK